MELILVQHTQSIHHTNQMIGAHTDWELTTKGLEDAIAIADYLAQLKISNYSLVSSDLLRTKQTANEIAKRLNLEVEFWPLLREIDLGEATGKSIKWFNENKACEDQNTFRYKPFSSAESYYDLFLRMKRVKEKLKEKNENTIVVSHGGAINYLLRSFISDDEEVVKNISFRGKAGGISFIVVNEHLTIKRFNYSIK